MVAMYLALLGKWLSLKKGQQKIGDFDHDSMAWKINYCRTQRPKVYFRIIWLMYSCLWRETSIDSKLFSTGNLGKWLFPKSSCSHGIANRFSLFDILGHKMTVQLISSNGQSMSEWPHPQFGYMEIIPSSLCQGKVCCEIHSWGMEIIHHTKKKSSKIPSNRWNSTFWPNFGCRPHNNDYCIWKSDSNPQTGPQATEKKT